MIVLEGPDGAGKTTLLKQLSADFPQVPVAERASSSVGGPVANLGEWVERDLSGWGATPISFYDRHPLVSEYIYGPVIRGHIDPSMENMGAWAKLFHEEAMVILCLPPLNVVMENLKAEAQMPGVESNISEIYRRYKLLTTTSVNPTVYDYTSESLNNTYSGIHTRVRNYLRSNR